MFVQLPQVTRARDYHRGRFRNHIVVNPTGLRLEFCQQLIDFRLIETQWFKIDFTLQQSS